MDAKTEETGAAKKPVRKAPAQWTAEKRRAFLAELGRTCNVSASAAKVKMSSSSAYALRARSAAFREGWVKALRTSYETLEMVLLRRAIASDELSAEEQKKAAAFPERIALTLYNAHRATVLGEGAGKRAKAVKSPFERVERRLAALEAEDGNNG